MKAIDILNADRYTVDERLQKVQALLETATGDRRWELTYEKNSLESRLGTLDRIEAARQNGESQCSLCGELVRLDRVMQHWQESCRGQR